MQHETSEWPSLLNQGNNPSRHYNSKQIYHKISDMQLHKANAPRFLKSNRSTPNKLRVQNFNVLPSPNRRIMEQKQRNGRAKQNPRSLQSIPYKHSLQILLSKPGNFYQSRSHIETQNMVSTNTGKWKIPLVVWPQMEQGSISIAKKLQKLTIMEI